MSNQINLVQSDTAPDVVVTLYDATNNLPIDVSNAGTIVYLKYRMEGSSSVLSITGTKTNGGADGVVAFVWPAGALDAVGEAAKAARLLYGNRAQLEAASPVTGNASRDVVPIRREIRISTPGCWNCPTRS